MVNPDGMAAPAAPMELLSHYWTDAWQRSILYLDVMRQRGAQYAEQAADNAPHVLDFEGDLVSDGRTFERPVNYWLARITPTDGMTPDPRKRPFVVVDPRAGHGPGIGGFKADSEIGVAMKAGHPAYLIGFLPQPVPGQTIEDIVRAEAIFLEQVIARHPEAEGKPCVIGNCQAGWSVMMVASLRPDLFGPIIIAGTPLSYWAGVEGQYPMRYSGGLLGGSWLTALTGDLGAGLFDGAWLVQNFENQNPANTLWTKQYNLYSKIDTEPERYLDFERWWGGHVTLNAEEMQFIVDELFVGNKLAAGEIRTSDGTAVDLRNIRSPIVVFCSQGDNITPPQQALDWILQLYDSVDEIRALGQTIVYTIHEKVGHLGIFVSGGVARKEHDEFATNIDMIDILPPGLYEAVLQPVGKAVDNPQLVTGQWIMRCEARTLDDIRALGGNSVEDERRFAAAARLSEINLALYRSFLQPFVQAAVTPQVAERMRHLHPLRLSYEMFAPGNPWMEMIEGAAAFVRENRQPVEKDNPFLACQEEVSQQIVSGLDKWRVTAEQLSEDIFRAVYGLAPLQAALGMDTSSGRPARKAPKSLLTDELLKRRIERLKEKLNQGGPLAGLVRALLFVGMARGRIDERGFEAIRRMRRSHAEARQMPPAEFKTLIREQYFALVVDEAAALAAIPELMPPDADGRRKLFNVLRQVLASSGPLEAPELKRLERISALLGLGDLSDSKASDASRSRNTPPAKQAEPTGG